MKKKRLLSIVLSVIFILSITTTTVITAYAGGTNWKEAPSSTAGSYSEAKNYYSCTTKKDKTAKGSNAYADWSTFNSLGTAFVSDNSRRITIKLMEYDPLNFDDEVILYKGTFSGRKLHMIWKDSVITKGNIETSGDDVCELYIKYKVDKLDKDPADPVIYSGLFKYKVGIN